MFERTCERCRKQFEAKVANKRFCGPDCFAEHRKAYGQHNLESRKVERKCRQCGEPYRRVYEKSGFCSIACGSKWNVDHGAFDAWKASNLGKRSGKDVSCDECGAQLYIVEHQFEQERHFCDLKCKGKYFGKQYTGSGNPMFGRKLSERALAKQKRSLLQNHGVTNAFFLSKHRRVSRAQQEILDHLQKTFPRKKFVGEKLFVSGSHKYFIDIFSGPLKTVVEFNGDYWHCNPTMHSGSFVHPRKHKTAEQIWEEDRQRLDVLSSKGYHTFVVWEKDYKADREGTLSRLTESVLSCSL